MLHNAMQKWRLRRLWWRHAYTFHWAHKPLCQRFRRDVLRFGRVHLCRSCFFAYAGIGSSLLFVVAASFLPWSGIFPSLFYAVAGVTVAGSLPWWYKRWPRWTRDLLRFGLGWSIVLCGALPFYGHGLLAGAGGVLLLVAWKGYYAMRDSRKQHACDGCHEFGQDAICSGFTLQAESVRAYETEATELVMLSMNDWNS